MTDFVDIEFTTSVSDLEDIALNYLSDQWDNYVPEDGDPEVILIEGLAPLAQNAIQMGANMPKLALAAFGVQVLGQPYNSGTSAYTSVLFTVQDNAGYTIPAGSQLEIDGYAFVTTDDAVVPAGSTTIEALVASTERIAAANDLSGTTSTTPLMMPAFVTGMTVQFPTGNGSDPQSDDDYVDQLSRDRRLISKALIVGLDFELAALDFSSIGRAHADMSVGRNITLTLLSNTGGPVAAPVKTQLAAFIATARTANAVVTLADPTFTTVSVTYTAQAESGFDPGDLLTRINSALTSELSPLTHGLPESGDPGNAVTTWINDPSIYAWRLVQVIGQVPGVHRVVSLAINGGANGADLALTGAVPVPQPGTMTGTIT